MLALNDPRWSTLSHAYGSAQDIPEMLRVLGQDAGRSAPIDSEPWFGLWSSLCHQDDVFEASYAAVPHIVDIGTNADGPVNFSFFQFPAAVEVARKNGRGPEVPVDLEFGYFAAIKKLDDLIAAHRNEDWDVDTLLSVLGAQAVAKGNHRVAAAIMNLDDVLIQRLIDFDFAN
jgi:hypothetical protein